MQRKHASPGMFFIINERLLSPPYGSMFCAAPFLSCRPVPCFPPSPSPPTCQSKIMIEPGWQAVSHQHGKWGLVLCLSLPPFSCPLASWSFSASPSPWPLGPPLPDSPAPLLSLYSPPPPPSSSGSHVCGQYLSKLLQNGCHDATGLCPLDLREEGPVSLINKSDLVLTGLCICPLSGWWINMSGVGAGTAWG